MFFTTQPQVIVSAVCLRALLEVKKTTELGECSFCSALKILPDFVPNHHLDDQI